eukprot:6197484-Pleurochrysis_carterae.AAC.2
MVCRIRVRAKSSNWHSKSKESQKVRGSIRRKSAESNSRSATPKPKRASLCSALSSWGFDRSCRLTWLRFSAPPSTLGRGAHHAREDRNVVFLGIVVLSLIRSFFRAPALSLRGTRLRLRAFARLDDRFCWFGSAGRPVRCAPLRTEVSEVQSGFSFVLFCFAPLRRGGRSFCSALVGRRRVRQDLSTQGSVLISHRV